MRATSPSPRDNIHDVVEIQIEAELRQAHSLELFEKRRLLLAQNKNIVGDISDAPIITTVAVVNNFKAVAFEQAPQRRRREVMQMRRRMNHAPLLFTESSIQAVDVSGRDCQQTAALHLRGNLFNVQMRRAQMLNCVPHADHVELFSAKIVREKIVLDDVQL